MGAAVTSDAWCRCRPMPRAMFEGVNNAIKLVGDQFIARLYRALRLVGVHEWQTASGAPALEPLGRIADHAASLRIEILEDHPAHRLRGRDELRPLTLLDASGLAAGRAAEARRGGCRTRRRRRRSDAYRSDTSASPRSIPSMSISPSPSGSRSLGHGLALGLTSITILVHHLQDDAQIDAEGDRPWMLDSVMDPHAGHAARPHRRGAPRGDDRNVHPPWTDPRRCT